jgi:signal transduction histidine kinase
VRRLVLWLLMLVACAALAAQLFQLYQQSATALEQRSEAEIARACDMIRDRYNFLVRNWAGSQDALRNQQFRQGLRAVVIIALAAAEGVEGGIWQAQAGPLAYAFPTYAGTGPKTDLPAAEKPRIRAVNLQAAQEGQAASYMARANRQTLLIYACPLGGPVPGLTAWTMTRVQSAPGYGALRTGLSVALLLMLGVSAWLAWIVIAWSRHVRRIESTLGRHNEGDLPLLALTGERELDRIVAALNEAGQRLAHARRRSEELAAQVAASERLAALGRVAAGVAHEIRNPIAAMRLRAENALAGDSTRMRPALEIILTQIARLDSLVRQLLTLTQRRQPHPETVSLGSFLQSVATEFHDQAEAAQVRLEVEPTDLIGRFDPDLARRSLGNLVLNAIQHTPAGGRVGLRASRQGAWLKLSVSDTGPGVKEELRTSLFEPFVTGRPEGTGLGLSIAREFAEAQGGRVVLISPGGEGTQEGAEFALMLPCPPS